MSSLRTTLQGALPLRLLQWVTLVRRILHPFGQNVLAAPLRYARFVDELRRFRAMGGEAPSRSLYPMLGDRGAHPVDAHYVTQAHWATRQILDAGPERHVDVASQTQFVAMLCAHLPVTYLDVRPIELDLPGLDSTTGTVLALPFGDRTILSISCLHVLEHIGLGRYGDPLDPGGTQHAAEELTRVLAPGGRLYVSVPVGRPRIEFNAHRVHSVAQVRNFFAVLELVDFAVVDDEEQVCWGADPDDPRWSTLAYGCGMFEFRAPDRTPPRHLA